VSGCLGCGAGIVMLDGVYNSMRVLFCSLMRPCGDLSVSVRYWNRFGSLLAANTLSPDS
jgi:hypothetical protein